MLLLCLFFSTGEYNYIYKFLAENNLLFYQRLPSRFLLPLNFIIPILSIFGLLHIINNKSKPKYCLFIILIIFIYYLINISIISELTFNNIKSLDYSFVLIILYLIFRIINKNFNPFLIYVDKFKFIFLAYIIFKLSYTLALKLRTR